jgi:hypothetical protein
MHFFIPQNPSNLSPFCARVEHDLGRVKVSVSDHPGILLGAWRA